MAYTQTQLDALQAALASGELRVSYDNKTVEYRSVAEIKIAIAEVSAALAEAAGTGRPRQVRSYPGTGL